jgi:hypothetical protein
MMGLVVQELIRGLDFYGRRRRLEVLARMPRANQGPNAWSSFGTALSLEGEACHFCHAH